MTTLPRYEKIVRTLLYLHVPLALFVGTGYLIHLGPGFGQGGMDARELTASFWAFAVLLFLAARRFAGDPRWLYAVLAVVGLKWLDYTYEFLGQGDRAYLMAFLVTGTLLGLYVAGAIVLAQSRRAPRPRGQAARSA
jgi:hypothetical protein